MAASAAPWLRAWAAGAGALAGRASTAVPAACLSPRGLAAAAAGAGPAAAVSRRGVRCSPNHVMGRRGDGSADGTAALSQRVGASRAVAARSFAAGRVDVLATARGRGLASAAAGWPAWPCGSRGAVFACAHSTVATGRVGAGGASAAAASGVGVGEAHGRWLSGSTPSFGDSKSDEGVATGETGEANGSDSVDGTAAGAAAAAVDDDAPPAPVTFAQPDDGRSFVDVLKGSGAGGGAVGRGRATGPRPIPVRGKLPVPEAQPPIAQRLVNTIMRHGKKATAQRLFNHALELIKEAELKRLAGASGGAEASKGEGRTTTLEHRRSPRVDPMAVFLEAMDNLKPLIGVSGIKKGGATYQVPVPLSEKARTIIAVKWLVKTCRSKKGGKGFSHVLANEVMAAQRREGLAYQKKLELHKTAEANRAYSNLRRK